MAKYACALELSGCRRSWARRTQLLVDSKDAVAHTLEASWTSPFIDKEGAREYMSIVRKKRKEKNGERGNGYSHRATACLLPTSLVLRAQNGSGGGSVTSSRHWRRGRLSYGTRAPNILV